MSKPRQRRKKSSKLLEFCSFCFKKCMNGCGIGLITLFLLLIYLLLDTFIYQVVKFHFIVTESYLLASILLVIGLWLAFNITFNFIMAVITKPGGTSHLKKEESEISLQSHNEDSYDNDSEEEDLEIGRNPLKGSTCKECNNIKPLRAHHCSICGACVLRMDHHCRMNFLNFVDKIAWINNCVGHYNQRYFLLMIFYVLLGSGFFLITTAPMIFLEEYKNFRTGHNTFLNLSLVLSLVLFLMMIPFNIWNWFLAITGQTTIEFWGRRSEKENSKNEINDDEEIVDFRQEDKIKNLEYIFGTSNVFLMLMPSKRPLTHNGIDWESYMNFKLR